MSNTTFDPNCPYKEWYLEAGRTADYIIFHIFTPFYTVVAGLGHSFCLVAFFIQAKKEKAYMYQFFSSVSELFFVISQSAFVCTTCWYASPTPASPPTPLWFMLCYSCTWWSAHVTAVIANASVTMSELFALCMSADRLHALWKPFSYKSLNMKRIQIVAATVRVVVSISTSSFLYFRSYVDISENEDNVTLYRSLGNVDFLNSFAGKTLTHWQNFVRAFALMALYVCNIGLMLVYHKRKKKKVNVLQSTQKDKKKEEDEHILFLVTITQSSSVTLCINFYVVYFIYLFFDPSFYGCKGGLIVPLLNGSAEVMSISNFIFVITINKRFQKILFQSFFVCKKPNISGDGHHS